jgi:hypothetical protein
MAARNSLLSTSNNFLEVAEQTFLRPEATNPRSAGANPAGEPETLSAEDISWIQDEVGAREGNGEDW